MALAERADVELELGRALSEAEAARAPRLLSKASAAVIGYTGQDFEPSPYPEAVVGVVAEMVARVLAQAALGPVMPEQQSAGPFSVRYPTAVTSGGVWITAADKLALRPYRLGGGVTSVRMVGDRYDITPEV